jgi:hypothetical protein
MDFEEINLLMKEGAEIIRNLHAENVELKQKVKELKNEIQCMKTSPTYSGWCN